MLQWRDGDKLTATGPESLNPRTSEEADIVVQTIPKGYKVSRITIQHGFDPGLNPAAINDVEHTPRYWLYLSDNKLWGHVWLRKRGYNACPTKLRLVVTVDFYRDDVWDKAFKAGKAFEYPKDIFSRVVNGNVLRMTAAPNVAVHPRPVNPPSC